MPNRPLQIGITGGIGSGKSLICKIFSCLKIPIYDADTRAKWVMVNDVVLKNGIIHEFGEEAYTPEGQLNRQLIAATVFSDKEKLNVLNAIVHPRVAVDYKKWYEAQHHALYVIKEAALMFESGSYKQLDQVITVSAPEGLRIKRVLSRDPQRDEEQVRGIIDKQLTESERIKRADHVIKNDETCLVTKQVLSLDRMFKKVINFS